MLEELLPANLFAVMLIFARIGSALMLLPGFGEFYVMQRYRLLLALVLSALLTPVLAPALPPLPQGVAALVTAVGSEVAIGLFLGSIARILLSALDIAGTVVSLQLGLSSAQIFNPQVAQQGTLPSVFYGMLGVLLIFVTDLHHLLLRAMVDSYSVFTPGTLPPLGDFSAASPAPFAWAWRWRRPSWSWAHSSTSPSASSRVSCRSCRFCS